jgi:GTPase
MAIGRSLNYSASKDKLQNIGNTVLHIAQVTNNDAIVDFLGEVLEKLPKDEYYVAILGLFKRGKSTLINALIGEPILPTGVVPVTSVITRIRYGQSSGAKITFSDGATEEIAVEGLADYVTEAGNPGNKKNVTVADVYVPAQILQGGLILIDTPGVGSAYLSGTQTTFQFLDRADFAVFVLAVDPPVGQQELQLLTTLAAKSSKILFVLNKMDYVNQAALDESVRYCQKVIGDLLEPNYCAPISIFPVSAKLVLEGRLHNDYTQVQLSGLGAFEKALQESLIEKKESLVLTAVKNKVKKSCSDLITYLQLELGSLTMPLDNLAHVKQEFEQYLNLSDKKKSELFYVIQGRTKEIIETLDEDLAAFRNENENKLVERIEAFADEKLRDKTANSKAVMETVDDFIKTVLIEAYTQFIQREDSKLQELFQLLVNEADDKTNALAGDINEKAAKLFGFQAQNVVFSGSLSYQTRFYYHLEPVFTASITFSAGEAAELLPKSLFKGVLKRKLAQRVRSEIDKNGGRIRYDYFVTRIEQAALHLKQDINSALESSTECVHHAVYEAEQLHDRGRGEVSRKVDELKLMQSQLLKVKEELELV